MEKKKKTVILLATYNGERFLREQIDSLYAQTFTDWTIYAHDDGSSDGSYDILAQYAATHDNFKILDYPSQHSAKDNFLSMLTHVDADYYLFCDQDDVWKTDKIEKEMKHMADLELQMPERPIAVFSDLLVVDRELEVIEPSMWDTIGIRPELLTTFERGGVFEYVTGCTMMFNRKARKCVICPAPKATMHDTWTVLCILRQGGIVSAVCEPLVYYRQHGDNTLGASNRSRRQLIHKLRNISNIWHHDRKHWEMLKELGYGSFAKFLYYKYLYRRLHP